ncbi:unnamed protein product [Lota lota]
MDASHKASCHGSRAQGVRRLGPPRPLAAKSPQLPGAQGLPLSRSPRDKATEVKESDGGSYLSYFIPALQDAAARRSTEQLPVTDRGLWRHSPATSLQQLDQGPVTVAEDLGE